MYFIILPNQLFDKKYINKKYNIIIWEHPHYFKKYIYNKKKLILHFGSMKYYYDYLKSHNYNVKYIKLNEKFKIKNYKLFDPIDKIKLPNKYEFVESPNFILSKEKYKLLRKKTKKFFFHTFYNWGKKQIKILENVKSTDKQNRKKLKDNIKIPKVKNNVKDKKYINYGIKYTKKYFKNNYGNYDNFIFPLTHKTAKKLLNNFIKSKLNNFGNYQDYIDKK